MTTDLPAELLKQEAMLATPSKGNPVELIARMGATDRFVFDVKWDGCRAFAFVDHGQVQLRSRTFQDMTPRYPEIVAQLSQIYPKSSVVLDGELICFNPETGLPSFNRIQKREAQSKATSITALAKAMPATFVIFDILWCNGEDLRPKSLDHRLDLLRRQNLAVGNQQVIASTSSPHGERLWDFIEQHGLEGLIAKERMGRYTGRRDSGWVKLKRLHRVSALVTGYEAGKGARRGRVGALLLDLLDDNGEPVSIGKVGTGLKDADHGPLLEVLCAAPYEPFIVEVEYMGLTPDGKLRMPSYKGVRIDVTRDQCVLSQVRS